MEIDIKSVTDSNLLAIYLYDWHIDYLIAIEEYEGGVIGLFLINRRHKMKAQELIMAKV